MKIFYVMPLLIVCFYAFTEITFAQNDTATLVPDTKPMIEAKYDIVVFEPGYDMYLKTQLPKNHYGASYYRNWNIHYVNEWNVRAVQNKLAGAYQEQINYNPLVEYGIELDYKLYYFFQFIEEKYHITLVSRAGKAKN